MVFALTEKGDLVIDLTKNKNGARQEIAVTPNQLKI
jgi:hypothetical protein